jgi:hypothetical protein
MCIGSFAATFAGANALSGRFPTAGAASPCAGVRVHAAPDLTPEWAQALGELTAQLPPVADSSCPALTLSVEPDPVEGVRVAAMAADGRYAERTVPSASGLAATVLGLVASIPGELAGEEPDAGKPSGEPVVVGTAGPPRGASADASIVVAPAEPPRHVELWLGLAVGGRIGESNTVEMFDFEARADAVVNRWVLSLSLRYAPSIGPDNSDSTYEEVVFALGAGRRIPIGRGAVDLSVLPGLATMNMQWNEDDINPQSGGSSAFRIGLSARWSAPISEFWRFTVTADGDVTPAGLDHVQRLGPNAPALPTWTAGLRVGASGALW